ncbi:uncharacterized protein F4822DRAFT_439958 [Hypoxylon trugodes]|uniref:uncharacterized protein n=1 Tax=Hypoxylon trugodes TaxID=326681 RepID=UPI0021A11710|nr:uncharacterized protein F4822DRAFT_439958 [Hypoxylon trugodes]KAI1394390.1 hypothetical protein F4822DRAFT_439958 [Hypoxylon trugodes]
MSVPLGSIDTQGPPKRSTGVARRPRAASDSSSVDIISSSKRFRSPTPPPRRSSWGFSQHFSPERHAPPTKSSKPPLRRKLKLRSLRSQIDPPPIENPEAFLVKSPEERTMATPGVPSSAIGGTSLTGPDRGHSTAAAKHSLPMPGLSGNANGPVGNLLKGPVDDAGKLKDAALLVGIKLDLEAEVHATARVRGDIVVGLY